MAGQRQVRIDLGDIFGIFVRSGGKYGVDRAGAQLIAGTDDALQAACVPLAIVAQSPSDR